MTGSAVVKSSLGTIIAHLYDNSAHADSLNAPEPITNEQALNIAKQALADHKSSPSPLQHYIYFLEAWIRGFEDGVFSLTPNVPRKVLNSPVIKLPSLEPQKPTEPKKITTTTEPVKLNRNDELIKQDLERQIDEEIKKLEQKS